MPEQIHKVEGEEKLEKIMYTPFLKVVDFLLDNPVLDYSKKEIAEMSGISRTTLYRIWPILEKFDIVKETRKFQNTQLYSLDEDSEIVNELGRFLRELREEIE